jgi:hypothetical protein
MTVYAGNIIYASDINGIIAPGWTTYTPTLTNGAGTVTVGNGTISGRYRRVAGGDTVLATGTLVLGSTTSIGTSFVRFGLPINASAASIGTCFGVFQAVDSGNLRLSGSVLLAATDYVTAVLGVWPNTSTSINSKGGDMTNTIPTTWNTGDSFYWQIEYEPA